MNKEKKQSKINNKTLIAICMVLILLVGFFGGYLFFYLKNSKYNKYIEILDIIEKNGIECQLNDFGEELSKDEIAEILVNGLLESDTYKQYYTKSEYEALIKERQGKLTGVGISFGVIRDDETNQITEDRVIARVIGNSPANKSGLKPLDVICEGKTSTSQYEKFNSYDEIVDFISEVQKGEKFYFKVKRNKESIEIPLSKEDYVASYVVYASSTEKIVFNADNKDNFIIAGESMPELKDDTAYILLDEFNGDAGKQFLNAINYAYSNGKSKIIFDLRDNGGGKMDVMLEIASCLIYNGGAKRSEITVTKFKSSNGKERKSTYSTNANNYKKDKLSKIVVLANGNTASASECLINAMLYYGKANLDGNFNEGDNLIISKGKEGAKTFGKGIMQTTFDLKSGGALKLTTAKLYAPDGTNCIHNIGFTTTEQNSVENKNAISRAIELLD